MAPNNRHNPNKKRNINVRHVPDETKRRLASAKSAQGLTSAQYFDRLERLHRLVVDKARTRRAGAVVLFARAILGAVGLRYD